MDTIYHILEERFHKNMHRHPWVEWSNIVARLENWNVIKSLELMESTGGEPDIVSLHQDEGIYTFIDCSPESPTGRRSLCYDRQALDNRRENKPKNSVIDMANTMWITLLTEEEYRLLQSIESVDTKTSSWITTPESIRHLGWALFCDRRYNTVFTYHNGADSYYAVRWWRWKIHI